jgi:serine/threonine protein kinase
MTEGIYILHSNKIAHCNIKPENIAIDESMNIKFTDFS